MTTKKRKSPYVRVGQYPLDQILPHIGCGVKKYDGYLVKTNSIRLQTFKVHGTNCVKCGAIGSHFAIEKDRASVKRDGETVKTGFHINLYAINAHGNEVLMTKDHIHPKSLGGPDTLENMQPMCVKCNTKKGNFVS